MNKKLTLLTLIILISPINFFAQTNSSISNNKIVNPTSNYANKNNEEKNYWLPAIEVFGLNILVWSNSKFLVKQDWANINGESISENFRKGLTWDDDGFSMNQFFHPYHGSAYFNAARSNGLSFWESAPYVLGGSLMWEYAMETTRPSYNDLLNTTLSGITLGEITFRISDLIIDESASGLERFTREFTSTLMDPVKGFNRLIQGKMWRDGIKNERADFSIQLSLGLNSLFVDRDMSKSYLYSLSMFDMNYGNKWSVSAHKKPFDYIRIHTEIGFTKDNKILGISTSGVVWDWKFNAFNTKKNIFGLYKEFDYLENNVYKFSATSLAAEITNKTISSNGISLQSSVGLSTVFMGGSNSIYSSEVGKKYNLGPGLGMRILMNLQLTNSLSINFKYKQYWIHILNGLSGNEFIGLFNLNFNYRILQNNSVGLSVIFYERYGKYSHYTDIYSANTSARIFTKFYL